MVAAISSSHASIPSPGSGGSTAGLEAQLTRYQKELSDCVNCESSKTPEGKANILELQVKISSVKERIEKAKNDAVQTEQSATKSSIASDRAQRSQDALSTPSALQNTTAKNATTQPIGALGHTINVTV